MDLVRLFPNWRYLFKLMLSGVLAMVPVSGFFTLVSFQLMTQTSIYIPTDLLLIPLGLLFLLFIGVFLYFRSIRYEIHDDEIIVYSGFLNKSIKHVNFRNITNMELKRTILDRLLGIGSLSIQTAGSGGTAIPEEKLAGLNNVYEVYDFLAEQLREYRSTGQSNSNIGSMLSDRQLGMAMLQELRAIRALLSQ